MNRSEEEHGSVWESILLISLDTFMLLAVMGITLGVILMVINTEVPNVKSDQAPAWGRGDRPGKDPTDRVSHLTWMPALVESRPEGRPYIWLRQSEMRALVVDRSTDWPGGLDVVAAGVRPEPGVDALHVFGSFPKINLLKFRPSDPDVASVDLRVEHRSSRNCHKISSLSWSDTTSSFWSFVAEMEDGEYCQP